MDSQKFGGRHTEQKLQALEKYLERYTTAMKNQSFPLVYFDAFAGAGGIEIGGANAPLFGGEEFQVFTEGSVRRALRFGDRFDHYIFVEEKKRNVAKLEKLVGEYPAIAERIRVICGDANVELRKFCGSGVRRGWRAVVFLDPYGNDVEWNSIVAMAKTEAIDLWYLFPAGLGVDRQIGKGGTVHFTHEASLNRLFGTTEWKTEFLEDIEERDLFNNSRSRTLKTATPDSITRYMIKRLKEVFRGGVLDDWYKLGSRGIHMYSLLFACANPRGNAANLALTLAAGVLRSERRGRAK